VEEKQADYVFTVKDNQPTSSNIADLQLDAFPPQHTETTRARAHRDSEHLDQHRVVGYLGVPYSAQSSGWSDTGLELTQDKAEHEVVFGVTSLPGAGRSRAAYWA